MAYRQDWERYIRQRAARLALDPQAALSVAASEGLSGAVGDQGTSFGPFQLHVGGALPAGRGRSWAESPAGIDYALSQIASVARGKRGKAAIEAIVRQFERPADPGGEIQRALGYYGSFAGGSPALAGGSSSGRTLGSGPRSGGSTPSPPAISLLDPMTELQNLVAGKYDPTAALQDLADRKRLRAAEMQWPAPRSDASPPPEQPAPPPTSTLPPRELRKLVIAGSGMDRQGVPTNPAVFQFVGRVAQLAGRPLTIGTGSNHHQYVKGEGSTVSDHWYGEAADVPATGAELTRLGQDALIAAGMDPREARQQKGGVFNVGGYNILFNTNVGGNHYNHLHVGLGRILGRGQ